MVNRQRRYGGYGGASWFENKVYPPPCPPRRRRSRHWLEEGECSFGRRFHRVVDLVQSTSFTSLVSQDSDQFKGSMATTSAPGRWSLGARARKLPGCHQQRQADSARGAARRRLALAAGVVARWFKDLEVMFIMFEMFCTACELIE